MSDAVLQVVELGSPPWPTVDPFLFCVHHLDHYPAGDERLAPRASLTGRQIGNDFSGRDGWSMYHGQVVPGFPQHPHRGFETVTFARQGTIDHSDSLGATARFSRGDVQWMTAGRGVVHAEMFPLLDREGPNTTELFQIWLNLPAADKMADPSYTMLWSEDIPRLVLGDDDGNEVEVTVIAGELEGFVPPAAPPDSWASRPGSDVVIWHLRLDAGATFTLPAVGDEVVRTLYVFEGGGVTVDGVDVGRGRAALLGGRAVPLRAGPHGAEALLLGGRPIGEPVAQYGPFVMNDRAGIEQAFRDYQRDGFGGWPWPRDDPDHGPSAGRFAVHADGRREDRDPQPAAR